MARRNVGSHIYIDISRILAMQIDRKRARILRRVISGVDFELSILI